MTKFCLCEKKSNSTNKSNINHFGSEPHCNKGNICGVGRVWLLCLRQCPESHGLQLVLEQHQLKHWGGKWEIVLGEGSWKPTMTSSLWLRAMMSCSETTTERRRRSSGALCTARSLMFPTITQEARGAVVAGALLHHPGNGVESGENQAFLPNPHSLSCLKLSRKHTVSFLLTNHKLNVKAKRQGSIDLTRW